MEYSVSLTLTAEKDILRLEKSIRKEIADALDSLTKNPFANIKKLKTPLPGYRLRVGDHRILFAVEKHSITVYSIKHRKDVYRR